MNFEKRGMSALVTAMFPLQLAWSGFWAFGVTDFLFVNGGRMTSTGMWILYGLIMVFFGALGFYGKWQNRKK